MEERNDLPMEDEWDDIDTSDLVDEPETDPEAPETGADQPGDPETPAEEQDKADQPEPDADAEKDTFELKHLDEVHRVDRAGVVQLAQKGLDYDRIKGLHAELEAFIKEMAGDEHANLTEYMDEMRAQKLAQRENIEIDIARQRVALDRRERAVQAKEQAGRRQDEATSRQQADIQDFLNKYKDVDVQTIPKEVWAEVRKGSSLVDAYGRYENAQLKAKVQELEGKLQTKEQNQRNQQQSTGSQKSSGKDKTDPIDEIWDSDDY